MTADASDMQALSAEFLTEELGVAPGVVVPTARFWEDYGIDSLDLLELAVHARERFGAEISDDALATIQTVGDFARCVADAVAHRDRLGESN